MIQLLQRLPVYLLLLLWMSSSVAGDPLPWGRASPQDIDYTPQKVVYDVAAPDIESFSGVLDRVSYLNNIYHADPFEAPIVLVLHGDEIPFFAVDKFDSYQELMRRAPGVWQS